MSNETAGSPGAPAPRQKRFGWVKVLGIVVVALGALVLVAYFVGTSSAFVKSFVLPRVSKSLNAQVTVSDASVSPFSQVVLRDLQVRTTGPDPLVSASEVRLRYSLMQILRGNIKIDEINAVGPKIILIENPDGSSNLDPILKGTKQAGTAGAGKPSTSKPSKPTQLDVGTIAVTDGSVRRTKVYNTSNRDVTEITKLNLKIENVRNGQTGKMNLGADLSVNNNPPAPGTNGIIQGALTGNFSFTLTADLKPASVQGAANLAVSQASGGQALAAGLTAGLDCDVTPTEIRRVLLHVQKGSTPLAQFRVSGPFDLSKKEGDLQVQLEGIDRQILNIAGAAHGIDFGNTKLAATNQVRIAQAGKLIAAGGHLDLSRFQITRTNQTTPPLDLRSDYNVTINSSQSNAVLNGFVLEGTAQGKPLLTGSLSRPMTISWGNVSSAVEEAALQLSLTNLDLAAWKAFVGDKVPAGLVNGRLQLISQQGGEILAYDLNSRLENLTVIAGTNRLADLGVLLTATGTATNLQQFQLPQLRLQMSRQAQELITAAGSGYYDKKADTADFQLAIQAALERLFQLMPQPNINITTGGVAARVHLTQKQTTRTVAGSVAVTNLTAQIASNVFNAYTVAADVDLTMKGDQVQIRSLTGKLSEAGRTGGAFDVSGTLNTSNKAAQVNAKLTDFNENGLRPFLQPAMGDNKLMSILLNGDAAAQYDPSGASSIKANLILTNLVVKDPQNQFPATALDCRVVVDASVARNIADIRQCELGLTPTARAANVLRLSGRADLSQTNATSGNISITADSLDVTRYYDLFARKPAATAINAPSSTPARASGLPASSPTAGPTKEPEPKRLPFQNFIAQAKIGKLYLRELEATNFQTTVQINGGKVLIKPCEVALNGAPINLVLDLDLGVPGFKYNADFRAVQVPLPPLVNTFQPERRGQIAGTFTGVGKIAGAGTTGANLQKNLEGNFNLGSTNLNLAVPALRSKLLKTIINVVAIVPELKKNPSAALGTLTGALFGGSAAGTAPGSRDNVLDEFMQSPIDIIQARGAIGQGRIDLQDSLVQSPAFQADARGSILIKETLTNSTLNLPLTVLLKRSIAEKINFVPAGTPTNVAYVKLPDYVTIKGTISDPKSDINKTALLGTALQQIGQSIPGLDKRTGDLLQNLGGALTGSNPAGTNALGTNATARGTNTSSPASAVGSLLDQFLRPKASPTNAPAPAVDTAVAPDTDTSPATDEQPAVSPANRPRPQAQPPTTSRSRSTNQPAKAPRRK